MSKRYGERLRLAVDGGSHDEKISMALSGFPKGFHVDTDELLRFMRRRAPGNAAYATKRKEPDIPVFLSGLDENGVTNGDEICAVIYNTNQHSSDYSSLRDTPRPSHADYAAVMKYGDTVDLRGGGHFSGRLTAPYCIAGGICMQYLLSRGIRVFAHAYEIAGVTDTPFDLAAVGKREYERLRARAFPTLSEAAETAMLDAIEYARLDGDSVGGVVEVAVTGLPAGLGEHLFAGVEARVASAVFAVPAVKGVEFGDGFAGTRLRGSEHNDAFVTDGSTVFTETNRAGGILGGMTSGMPLILRAAVKATPSISKPQRTVSLTRMENVTVEIGGRHDPCIVPRAVPAIEAAVAVAVCDILLSEGKDDE